MACTEPPPPAWSPAAVNYEHLRGTTLHLALFGHAAPPEEKRAECFCCFHRKLAREFVILRCRHRICKACLRDWLMTHNRPNCPICDCAIAR